MAGGDPRLLWLAGDGTGDLIDQLDAVDPGSTDAAAAAPAAPSGAPGAGPGSARIGIVDPDERKLRLARRVLAEGDPWRGRSDIWYSPVGLVGAGAKVAFLFPGVEPTFGVEDMDLPGLGARFGLTPPPIEDDTVAHRSASIYRTGIFLDRVLRGMGVAPDVIAGHSIGEWSGSVAAGIIPSDHADELLEVVDLSSVELPDLDFAAFSAGVDAVAPVIDELADILVSHDNAPGQSIVCGRPGQVDEALARLRTRRVLGYKLGFQSGFHTPAMAESLPTFRTHLERMEVGPGDIPMWSATSVDRYPGTRAEIIDLHLRHLMEPVRFRPLVERLYHDAGVRVFVQVGVGSLTSFVADTLAGLDHAAVAVLAPRRSAIAQAHRALTALWVEGAAVGADALRGGGQPVAAPVADPATGAAGRAGGDEPSQSQPVRRPGRGALPPRSVRTSEAQAGAQSPQPVRRPEREAPPPQPVRRPEREAPPPQPVRASETEAGAETDAPSHRPGPATAPTPPPSSPPAPARPAAARAPAGVAAAAVAVAERPLVASAPAVGAGARPGDGRALVPPAALSPAALGAAADMLTAAARAGQDVLGALVARLAPATAEARPSAVVAPPAPPPTPVGDARAAAPPAPVAAPPEPAPPAASVAAPAAAPAPAPWTANPPQPWPEGPVTIRRLLSLATMPETLDHTLYTVAEGWPDVSDRFPIVAMTTQLQLLEDIAVTYAGGREVVELFGVRNYRWLDISEPLDLDITVTPKGDDVLMIALGPYCRANVRVGRFPAAPRYDDPPLVNPRPTTHTAQEMFDLRLMFHGPGFQGIPAMGPIGDDGMLGTFDNLATPGSLLDNLGKLIAYWAIDFGGVGEAALPSGVARVEWFGPKPAPGVEVRCDIRMVEQQRDLVRADGVLVLPDGTILARVTGWTSILFHLDELMEPLHHDPGHHDVAEAQPGGWYVVRERWPTGPARDLTGRRYLNRAERAHYATMNLLEQRRWLIDVIAAKDAVRHWLRDTFGIACFPVEVTLAPDGARRFRVECARVPAGHDPRVTLCPHDWTAVAVVGDGGYRDIEAVAVGDHADAATAAEAAAAAVAARNPGAPVSQVERPLVDVPSRLEVPPPPPFAVAWT